ncbi:MAG: sigma-E factor negative regulatory protein [Methylibium sp.]|uniref:sigma-E factor negative regulatory protein n=1 Tax=Methylibium sp. TaxID=2067992 RepID=UPI0018421B0D|nr:sigma-E factor negative regulatory protein [Methylibium sp.]MBA3596091.1 sigma-E factor negative regulatory protein [Methylibium sp.]
MKEADNLSSMQALSALADGQADAALAASLSAAWRDDPGLRERWHAYHLIGDVLRSDDLAACAHDVAFLQRLRSRLEREPIVLAPSALETSATAVASRTRASGGLLRRWATPAAVAAGFVAVAGVLTVTRMPITPDAAAPQLAQLTPSPVVPGAPGLVGPVAVVDTASEREEFIGGVLIRDARLDQYLTAHKQFGGSSALGVPSGFLRSATFERPSAAPGSR